jgi:hypothetical protein
VPSLRTASQQDFHLTSPDQALLQAFPPPLLTPVRTVQAVRRFPTMSPPVATTICHAATRLWCAQDPLCATQSEAGMLKHNYKRPRIGATRVAIVEETNTGTLGLIDVHNPRQRGVNDDIRAKIKNCACPHTETRDNSTIICKYTIWEILCEGK